MYLSELKIWGRVILAVFEKIGCFRKDFEKIASHWSWKAIVARLLHYRIVVVVTLVFEEDKKLLPGLLVKNWCIVTV